MCSRRVLAPALLCLAVALPSQGKVNNSLLKAQADDAGAAAARRSVPALVVQRARAAVVYVFVEIDGAGGAFAIERASSGVVIDPAGLIVTWAHLVREAQGADDKRLLVQLDDAANTRLPAAIVSIDDATGLALLRVEHAGGALPYVQLGPDRPLAGETAVVVARPEGKEMLAFAGVASPALAAVKLGGKEMRAEEVFLCDSRNDERCDGAPVLDGLGCLLGLYAAEHVQRDISEPTLEDLKKPSFGVVLPAGAIRRAFASQFAAAVAANAALAKAPSGASSQTAEAVRRAAPSIVSVWAGEGDWPHVGAEDPGAVQRIKGLGSGVVLSKKGLVVANAHVCRGGSPRVRVGDREFPAAVVKTNGDSNLSLLQVELLAGMELQAADCNPDDDAILGEAVLAIGNPLGTQVVVTAGVVSARRGRDGARIQADANLGNQNGGGAVVDVLGRVLGIGDAGARDPLDLAFAQRGDRVTTETNLSTFVGIGCVRRVFASEIEAGADAAESIRAPAAVTDEQRARRENALTAMVAKASEAMLNVYVARNIAKVDEDNPFASTKEELVTLGLGSGVIIDRSGLALSNWHVVDEAVNPDGSMKADHKVTVRVFGGKTYPVKVLSISREDDLSLLQLQLEPGEEVHAVELGDSVALAVGENVAAIGNPHGRANTITYGVVSAKDQGIRVRGRWAKLANLIETDAAINGGNSGGALLDMTGRLVGINSAGGGTFNNKGYAIAVDHVRRQVVGLLFQAYKLRSVDLGMRVIDDEGRVAVMDVDDRGPAAQAGVQGGDRIVALDDVPITWSPGFALTLSQKSAGTELSLQLERKGAPVTVKMMPLSPAVWAVVRQSGLLVRDLAYAEDPERVRTAAIALHRAFTGDARGEPTQIPDAMVLVDKVFPGEQPAGTDVQPGDLLLAIELVRADTEMPVLVPVANVDKLRDVWNDRLLGTYEGSTWRCWIGRGAEVKKIELTSKRLFW